MQIEIADGFSLNRVSPVPAEVTLTGPTSELEQVASVAAVVPAQSRLNDSVTLEAPLAKNQVVKIDLNEQAKQILEKAREKGVEHSFLFIAYLPILDGHTLQNLR